MAVIVTTNASRQGVATSTLVEGRAVVVGASGVRNDLPVVTYASANTTLGVYIAFFPPDDFNRPTYADMYTVPAIRTYNLTDGSLYGNPVFDKLQYLVPRSMWLEPPIYSGELVALHRGKIGITSGCFVDSSNIRVPGAMVAVGASGMFTYTSTANHAVGIVDSYQSATGTLYIELN